MRKISILFLKSFNFILQLSFSFTKPQKEFHPQDDFILIYSKMIIVLPSFI